MRQIERYDVKKGWKARTKTDKQNIEGQNNLTKIRTKE